MASGIINRSDIQQPVATGSTPGFIPTAYAQQIIQEAAKSSAALSTFRQVPMPTKSNSIPVLDLLPTAQWVTGEPTTTTATDGKKAPTTQGWKGVVLTAEEIAAWAIIPEAILEDSSINLWDEIAPRVAEAIGVAVDAAAFAGVNKPTTWPAAIISAAVAAGNVVTNATPDQSHYSEAMGLVEADGYMVRQFYSSVGQMATYRGWNAGGIPVYLTDIRDDGRTDSIYGVGVRFDEVNYLSNATTNAVSVLGDPTKALLGTRTDIQYKVLDQATLDVSAAQDGSELVHLAQQDSIALRVRARFGFAVANPVTHLQPTAANRYPFAVIRTAVPA